VADLTAACIFAAAVFVMRFPEPVQRDYESAVHAVPSGFTSAIASWNIDSPATAWIEVGMRARVGQRWTAWFDMGEWSPELSTGHRRSHNGQRDADGRVDTDTLVLSHAADAVQLRVIMHPAAGGGSPALRLLAVTTDLETTRSISEGTAMRSTAWGMDLPVPERTQRVGSEGGRYGGGGDSWCSPASISMVMAYWAQKTGNVKWDIGVADAAAGTYDPVYDGCGNWPFNVAFASQDGLEGWVARLPSLVELERYIADGVPVVASIRVGPGDLDGAPYPKTAGHLLVVRGFTSRGDVIVNDPYAQPGSIRRIYRRAQFEHVWQTGSRGAVYLIAPTGRLPAP
jgi:Peptidase_C39 like family